MQLNKIKIHNIASIEDAEIDFQSGVLRDASIFLICGETGAGKSTILDAICLALYGDTPRMASVKKEELELTDESVRDYERYYNNDNSQLLRRGAGEGSATLYFTGNDGRDYEAVWEVHRAHNKPNKRLLTPTRTLRASDGSFAENRKGEIKAKVEEVTGLQFEQFCRTVMLAQGEFTKFLKSGRNEKSEILEKLTGTEIYSRLGASIAEHYAECQKSYDEIKREVELIKPLDPEKVEVLRSRLVELSDRASVIITSLRKAEAIRKWIEADRQNKERLETLKKELSDLEEAGRSESMMADRKLIEDYGKCSTGCHILSSLTEMKSILTEKSKKIDVLRNNLIEAKEKEKEEKIIFEEKEKEAEKATAEAEKVDNVFLASEIKRISDRDLLLASVVTSMQLCEDRRMNLEKLISDKDEVEKRLREYKTEADSLRLPIDDKEKSLADFSEKLEQVRLLSSDAVKELRSNLKIGDDCPVCGQRVNALLPDEYFESRLEPLKQVQKRIENDLLVMKGRLQALENLLKESELRQENLSVEINEKERSLKETDEELKSLLRLTGHEGNDLVAVKETIQIERSELKKMSINIHENMMEGEELRRKSEKLNKEVKKLRINLEKATEKRSGSEIALESANAEMKTLENSRLRLEEELEAFFKSVPEISPERLSEISSIAETVIRERQSQINTFDDTVKITKGKLAREMEFSKEHSENKPDFEEGDSIEDIVRRISGIEKEQRENAEESGKITEQLKRDEETHQELERKILQLDKAREDRDKWDLLYKRLGDQKGSKFRSVAQSYILKSLLDNANKYMRSFSDRYTLTCNPGTLAILVTDSFKPSDPQPATILSGGESFMASLALALALSNLRSGGMSVDILFIDEGFGTLSAEYLGNVMDTLEKLYQIGGRKVGLISHVPEMRERIATHIEIKRESPAKSVVEVIDIGA